MSKDTEKRKSVLGGAASAVLAKKAPKNLLGYEKVHHGTSSPAADSIKKSGISKSRAGTGVGANDVAAGRIKHSDLKGKVYTSKNRLFADNHQPSFAGVKMGKTVTARMPYRPKSRRAVDTVINNVAKGKDNIEKGTLGNRAAATMNEKDLRIYKHSVKPRFIEGGKGYAGRKQFASKGNMRRYLSTGSGKARFAKGVAQAAGSAASGMYSIAHGLKARKKD